MTSSLVGSEMCIRDRSSASRVPPSLYTSPGTRKWCNAKNSRADRLYQGCLLYTSDAADDM
eukprot:2662632-Prorocentrum_lima.AAC.1